MRTWILLVAGLSLWAQRPRVTPTPAPEPQKPNVPIRIQARKDRMDRYLLPALRRAGVNAWLVVTREATTDPIAFDLAAEHAVGRAVCLFLDRGDHLERVAIVASYDTDAFEKSALYDRVVAYGKEGAGPALKQEIETLNPRAMAVDQSLYLPLADGLTAGNLQWIRETIGPDLSKRLVSAEPLLVSYRSRKTPAEIVKMREAVKKTEQILAEALSPAVIVPGKTTERDVAAYIRSRRHERGLGPSWDEDQDPNVMAGVSRGHSGATDALILPGAVVRIDAGVDDGGYRTDIQRLAYVLRADETTAPFEVEKAFETVRAANRAAAAALKPGATGTAVDTAARAVVTGAGYPEFLHATGHPIGSFAHDIGPLLAPNWPDRYGKLGAYTIEKDQTFAIEPSLETELSWMLGGTVGFGLEEDYVVTENGSEPLGTPQEKLVLIPSAPEPSAR